MKKIIFITPNDEMGASSRYRVYQFLKYLDISNWKIYPFMTEKIYKKFKSGKLFYVLFKVPFLIIKRLKIIFIVKRNDTVFIHRDIIPFGPMLIEKILKWKGCRIILDLDDAVYCDDIEEISSNKNRFMYRLKYGKRFDTSIKNADLVVCGNKYIEEHASHLNNNTIIIPTVIDTEAIQMKDFSNETNELVIGWIGNPGNTNYVYNILKQVNKKWNVSVKVILIGAKRFDISIFSNLKIEFYDWNKETEYDILRKCDVGIMPLNDTEWSKGKCGLKLLQYMAIGIPGIASDVGVNTDIIIENKNGWIVKNNDWAEALTKVISHKKELNKMSFFCREFVEKNYSINRYKKVLEDILTGNTK